MLDKWKRNLYNNGDLPKNKNIFAQIWENGYLNFWISNVFQLKIFGWEV